MAFLGLISGRHGLSLSGGGTDVAAALEGALAPLPASAPITLLVHGFKYAPGHSPGPRAPKERDPFRLIYAFDPVVRCNRMVSWPGGLGFTPDDPGDGLCIGFGWSALPTEPGPLAVAREFPRIYRRAGQVAGDFARLMDRIAAVAPGRPISIVAHSLGARVALCALPRLSSRTRLGPVILMGAAEYAGLAADHLRAAHRAPQVFNITARENQFYTQLFEWYAPRHGRRDRAIGIAPLEGADVVNVPIDAAATGAVLGALGRQLDTGGERRGHWGFYTRTGALDFYAALIRARQPVRARDLRRLLDTPPTPRVRSPFTPFWPSGRGREA
ncbi:MAG: hypothetical protein AAFQ51_02045 [Pseudomonadota bacterium]